MNTYSVIFTINQSICPLTETVKAETVEAAKEIVVQMCKDADVVLIQVVSVVEQ